MAGHVISYKGELVNLDNVIYAKPQSDSCIKLFVVGSAGDAMGMSSGISYIPPWLALASIGFAVLVGMVAGYFPALRAMRLSPLAAIRNE